MKFQLAMTAFRECKPPQSESGSDRKSWSTVLLQIRTLNPSHFQKLTELLSPKIFTKIWSVFSTNTNQLWKTCSLLQC